MRAVKKETHRVTGVASHAHEQCIPTVVPIRGILVHQPVAQHTLHEMQHNGNGQSGRHAAKARTRGVFQRKHIVEVFRTIRASAKRDLNKFWLEAVC